MTELYCKTNGVKNIHLHGIEGLVAYIQKAFTYEPLNTQTLNEIDYLIKEHFIHRYHQGDVSENMKNELTSFFQDLIKNGINQ